MMTLLIAALSFGGFIVAYNTYGRWLSGKIFGIDATAEMPSSQLRDDVDYVPTSRQVLFGHHFTSIAGTGPIVGPAIAVFWGWLPALLWVLLGSVFVGAVHDFGSLVVSMRNRGQTIGEVAGRLINPRARLLFLLILFFALTVVLAIFGLVIATIFTTYPESVLSVWIAMPLAVAVGLWVYKARGGLLLPSVLCLGIVYLCVWIGVYQLPLTIPAAWLIMDSQVITWTVLLMIYCFFASVLPVWVLLQPRDYINSQQLLVALILLLAGLTVAGISGKADLLASAPAISATVPADAPPIFPFLFITIACGACSGFHCLVSSGTSSKQLASETDAQYVGYGSMLMEGALAVLVILACCAGVGMGRFEKADNTWVAMKAADNSALVYEAAWRSRYPAEGSWENFRLQQMVGAFVEGSANFLNAIGIPLEFGIGCVAVLVACFAATTLDTATRLQRYVIQELAATLRIPLLTDKFAATGLAVALGSFVAMMRSAPGAPRGTGGLILWPLFGATNQLLAGLAFLVIIFYLARRRKPIGFIVPPALLMIVTPAIALCMQIFGNPGWLASGKYSLVAFGLLILALQAWMVIEAILLYPRIRGVEEIALPPLALKAADKGRAVGTPG